MATITSLKFDIASKWDGSGVRQAQGDIRLLNQDLRRLSNTRIRVNVDVDDATAREQLRRLDNDFRNRATVITVDADTATAEAQIAEATRDRRMRVDIDFDRSVFDQMVRGFSSVDRASTQTFEQMHGMSHRAKVAIAIVTAAIYGIGPAGAIAGAAISAALPLAFVTATIAAVAFTDEGKAAFRSLGEVVLEQGKTAIAPVIDDVVGGIDRLKAAVPGLMPLFREAFVQSAQYINPLVDGLINLTENIMPGFNLALSRSLPVFEGMFDGLSLLGKGIADMFVLLSEHSEAFGTTWRIVGAQLGEFLRLLGEHFGNFADDANTVLGGLLVGLNNFIDGWLTGTTGMLAEMDESFGRFLVSFGQNFGVILEKILPALGAVTREISEMLTPALDIVIPPLADFIAKIGYGIAPVIEAAAPILKTLAEQFVRVLEALEPLIPKLSETAVKILETLTPSVQDLIIKVADFAIKVIEDWMPAFDKMLDGFVEIAPSLSAMVDAMASFVEDITPAAGLITGVAGAIWLVNGALAMNPFGLMAIAVAGLVTGLVYLEQKTGAISGWWNEMKREWDTGWAVMQERWGKFKGDFERGWNELFGKGEEDGQAKGASLSGWWAGIKDEWNTGWGVMTDRWNTFKTDMGTQWDIYWGDMKTKASTWWTDIQTGWDGFIGLVRERWNQFTSDISGAWDKMWLGIRYAVAAAGTAIVAAVNHFGEGYMTAWRTIIGWLESAWNTTWTNVKTWAGNYWRDIQSEWDTFLNTLRTRGDTFNTDMNNAWNSLWSTVKTRWDQYASDMRVQWDIFWGDLKRGADKWWGDLSNAWNSLWVTIQSRWDTYKGDMATQWDIFWGDIKRGADKWWGDVTSAWDGLWVTVGKRWEEYKLDMKGNWDKFWGDIAGAVEAIMKRIEDAWNSITGIFEKPMDGLASIWNSFAEPLSLPKIERGGASGGGFAEGGPVRGPGTATSDSIPARLSDGEHVWTAREVQAAGGHRAVESMRQEVLAGKGYAAGGPVEWMWARVQEMNLGMQLTSSYRNSNDHHGAGKAIDFSNGTDSTPQMRDAAGRIANTWGAQTLELIHSPFGMNIKDGRNVGDGFGFYGAGTMNAHRNHVHWAVAQALDGRPGAPVGGGMGSGIDHEKLRKAEEALAKIKRERDILEQAHRERQRFVNQVQAGRASRGVDAWRGLLAWNAPWAGHDPSTAKMIEMLEAAKQSAMTSGPLGGSIPDGERRKIIEEAMGLTSTPPPSTRDAWLAGMNTLIQRESTWNPGAVNNWDSNAAAGYPTKGLTQMRDDTFMANAVPGHTNIFAPVDNVASSINYIKRNYGTIENVQQARAGEPPKGYAAGTSSAMQGWNLVGENGPEMVRFRGGEQVKSFDEIITAIKSSAIGNTNQIIDQFTTEINTAIDRIGGQHTDALEQLVTKLSGEIKSFVSQAIQGQQASGQELAARIETQLRDFLEGALSQAGINMDMKVTLPNGSQGTPQDFVNAVKAQVLPELERALNQGVGKRK